VVEENRQLMQKDIWGNWIIVNPQEDRRGDDLPQAKENNDLPKLQGGVSTKENIQQETAFMPEVQRGDARNGSGDDEQVNLFDISTKAETNHKDGNAKLFETGNWWDKEWRGMPEFVNTDLKPFMEIIVRFRNREDVEDFKKLINQSKLFKQCGVYSIWHPKLELRQYKNKRYIDEP